MENAKHYQVQHSIRCKRAETRISHPKSLVFQSLHPEITFTSPSFHSHSILITPFLLLFYSFLPLFHPYSSLLTLIPFYSYFTLNPTYYPTLISPSFHPYYALFYSYFTLISSLFQPYLTLISPLFHPCFTLISS